MFALVALLAAAIGVVPAWILHIRRPNERLLAQSEGFAAGVLGGTGLVHLLGSSMEGFATFAPQLRYPVAMLLFSAGFLLVLLIESAATMNHRSTLGRPRIDSRIRHEQSIDWNPRVEVGARTPLLLLVLSLHSLIIGTALGAQESVTGATIILFAVVAHKSLAGFALGISYARANARLRTAAPGMVLFATMTPLGIVVGTLFTAWISQHSAHLFRFTFEALGGGTLFAIFALDMIRTQFSAVAQRWARWRWACAGFGIMALLAIWI